MRIIVCVDERGGMLFNRRRQSRDRAVTADIVATVGSRPLYMAPMSEVLFRQTEIACVADEAFLEKAREGDFCFVEDRLLSPLAERIEEITLYCWNRHYPADLRLDVSPADAGLHLTEHQEITGYSHEKITKERYCK